jgi:glutathione S-transferase
MYASPWAERVRWALTFKGVPYEKQNYQPGVDEEAVKKLTGQAQVPVLLVNGTVIPDSTAILNWLEEYKPQPALLTASEKDRAQVMLWEELMDGVLGPQARMLIVGHFLRSGEPELQQGGRYFAHWHLSACGERAAPRRRSSAQMVDPGPEDRYEVSDRREGRHGPEAVGCPSSGRVEAARGNRAPEAA